MNTTSHTVLILCPEDALRSTFTEKLNQCAQVSEVKSTENAMQAMLEIGKKQYTTLIIAMSGADIKSLNLVDMIQQNSSDSKICVYNNDPASAGSAQHKMSTETPEHVIESLFAAPVEAAAVPSAASTQTMPGAPKKILVVEDDEDLNLMYKIAFKKRGFQVETALNGIEGITAAVTFQPDLILLDIMMPQMNGYEVIEAMRKNSSMDTIIVINSNLEQEKDLEKALSIGANYYLRKSQYTAFQVVDMVANNQFK